MLNFSGVQTGEKIQLSVDLKTDDMNYKKYVMLATNRKPLSGSYNGHYNYNLITLNESGLVSFAGSNTTVEYEVGKWYHFDVVFDVTTASVDSTSGANTVLTANAKYYLNGELVAGSSDDTLIYDTDGGTKSYLKYVGYTIDSAVQTPTTDDAGNSIYEISEDTTLSTDNFGVKILSATETTGLDPVGSLTTGGHTKFAEKFSSDYTQHSSDNYRYVHGAFSFSLRDTSAKISDYTPYNNKAIVSANNPYKAENEEYLRLGASSAYGNMVLYDRSNESTENIALTNAGQDILHISADMMAEDYNSDKKLIFNENWNNDSAHYVMAVMDKNGYLGFHENGAYIAKVPYTTNVWYDIDVIFNFATGEATYYVDGREMAKTEISYENTKDRFKIFKFWIDKPVATGEQAVESWLSIDNLVMELRPTTNPPVVTPETPVYQVKSSNIPTEFTVAEGNVYEASMLVLDTEADTQTTLIAAAYNSDGELTSISATPAYDISCNPQIKLTVGADDSIVKVFLLNNYEELTPVQTELEFRK